MIQPIHTFAFIMGRNNCKVFIVGEEKAEEKKFDRCGTMD
jgi:hypothetical protein